MTITTTTAAELRTALEAIGYGDLGLTMACNGDTVVIQPCLAYLPKGTQPTFDNIEYYLVGSPSLPWLGGETLDKVADQLNHYAEMLAEKDKDLEQLASIRSRLQNNYNDMTVDEWEELFQTYSDYHKDVHGYRPRDVRRPWYSARY